MLLAGDIGGTKTDLAIYSPEGGPRRPLAEAEYRSGHYPSLEALVREFLAATALPVTWACFDVAGPVIDGRAKITNLPWDLSESGLAGALNLRIVHLLNRLAMGKEYGLNVRPVDSTEEALKGADIVVSATTTSTPPPRSCSAPPPARERER